MRYIVGRRIVNWSKLINGVKDMAKVKARFQLDDVRNLLALPAAEDPPAQVGINEHSPSLFEVVFDRRLQLIPRPPTARTDRFPIAFANSAPVIYRHRLRARN